MRRFLLAVRRFLLAVAVSAVVSVVVLVAVWVAAAGQWWWDVTAAILLSVLLGPLFELPYRRRMRSYGPVSRVILGGGSRSAGQDEWRDAWSAARRALTDTIRGGTVAIGGPKQMRQGSSATVAVTVSPEAAAAERLRQEMSAFEQAAVLPTPVTPVMRVTCTGEGFTVTPLAADDQVIVGDATWTFNVRADAAGRRELLVIVHLRVPVPDSGGWVTRAAISHPVEVSVSPASAVGRLVRANWQWIIGTVLGLAGTIAAWNKLLG